MLLHRSHSAALTVFVALSLALACLSAPAAHAEEGSVEPTFVLPTEEPTDAPSDPPPADDVEPEPTEEAPPPPEDTVRSEPDAEVPRAPASVSAVGRDASLKVSWRPPASDGGSPVVGYRVVAIPADDDVPVPPPVQEAADAAVSTVESLLNGETYRVVVRAINDVGAGLPGGASATPRTFPGRPRIESVDAADASAVIRWTRPKSNGGTQIREYVVKASPSGRVVRTDGDVRRTRVRKLTNGERATFTVAAVNAVGRGRQSEASNPVTPRRVAHFEILDQPARRVIYGRASRTRVALRTASGAGVPAQRVRLLARLRGTDRWREVADDHTGSGGKVSLRTKLPATAQLRLRHPIGAVVARPRDVRRVVVENRVTRDVETTHTRVGMTVPIRGRVSPDHAKGSRVRLQRRTASGWDGIATGRMVTRSRYRIRWKPRTPGSVALRVVRPADRQRAAGVSPTWRHTVNPENAADIARDILADKGITLAEVHVSGGSYDSTPHANIRDVANGRLAQRSCGYAPCGGTTISLRVLRTIRDIGRRGTVTISEIVGGNHASGSTHYSGNGVDINWVNGRHVGYGSGFSLATDACRREGANEVYHPYNDPYGGHHNHVHCGWE